MELELDGVAVSRAVLVETALESVLDFASINPFLNKAKIPATLHKANTSFTL